MASGLLEFKKARFGVGKYYLNKTHKALTIIKALTITDTQTRHTKH